MYAIFDLQTSDKGIMIIKDPVFKTDNAAYAESKVYDLCSKAVTSSVFVHTILCINEHGQAQFGTPKYFEHIPEPTPEPEPSEE